MSSLRNRHPHDVADYLLRKRGREDALKHAANRKAAYTTPTSPSWAGNESEVEFWERVRRRIVEQTGSDDA